MKLKSVVLSNFRAHKSTEIEFPDKGVIGLVGDNESGKTTILESLEYALYGARAIRGKTKDLRWRGAGERKVAVAAWVIEIEGETYHVTRSETRAEVAVGGSLKIMATGHSGVTEFMEQVIGMTHAEFAASYMCAQKDVARLATMKPMERQTFVRAVLDLTRLDKAVKDARTEAKEIRTRYSALEATIGDGEAKKQNAVEASRTAERAKVTYDNDAKSYEGAKSEADVAQAEVQASEEREKATEEIERTRVELAHVIETADRMLVQLEADKRDRFLAVENVEQFKKDLADLDGVEASLREFEKARDRGIGLEQLATELARATNRLDELKREIEEKCATKSDYELGAVANIEERLEQVRQNENDVRRRREVAQTAAIANLAAAKKLAETLTVSIGDGRCPTCQRELENLDQLKAQLREAHEAVRTHKATADEHEMPSKEEIRLQNEFLSGRKVYQEEKARRDRALAADSEVKSLSRQLAGIGERRRRIGEEMAELRLIKPLYNEAEHKLAKVRVEDLRHMQGHLAAQQNIVERLAGTDRKLAMVQDDRNRARTSRETLYQELRQIGFNAGTHRIRVKKFEAVREIAEKRNQAMQASRSRHLVAQERHRGAESVLKEWEQSKGQLDELAADLAVADRVANVLNGFRKDVLDSILPEMSELLTGFVSILTDGRHETASLDDTFGVTLYEDGLASPVVSGGTEDVSALALRLAVSQLITQRTGARLECIILDEPFGSLDFRRRANVMLLLRRLCGVFPQVILISHIAETRDAVDVAIEFEFDENAGHTRMVTA